MDLTHHQLTELRKKLPPEVLAVYSDEKAADTLIAIAREHELRIDQMSELENITSKIFLGLIDIQRFTETLTKELRIPQEKATTLAHDINEAIFTPIHDALVALHRGEDLPASTPNTLKEKQSPALGPDLGSVVVPPESPKPAPEGLERSMKQDLTQQKLIQPTHTPVVEKAVAQEKLKGSYKEVDPYREPIDLPSLTP